MDDTSVARWQMVPSQTKLGDEIYSGVVGIDSNHIALLLAQLNGLQVCAGDISCAFLQSALGAVITK